MGLLWEVDVDTAAGSLGEDNLFWLVVDAALHSDAQVARRLAADLAAEFFERTDDGLVVWPAAEVLDCEDHGFSWLGFG